MRALLVDAQGAGSVGRAFVEWIPAGIRSIGGVLEQKKVSFDLAVIEEFLKSPRDYEDYDIYFLSAMTSDLPLIDRASRIIKDVKRPLILGGPITFDVTASLKILNGDVAVIGEGERALTHLLDLGLLDGEIPGEEELLKVEGVAYLDKKGHIRKNPSEGYLTKKELNRLRPSTSVVKYYPYYEHAGVAVEILRGCSNFHRARGYHEKVCVRGCKNCSDEVLEKRLSCPAGIPAGCGFCSVGGLYGPPRSRDLYHIVSEIKDLIERGVKKISFIVPDPLDYKRDELVEPEPLTDPAFPEPNYMEIEKLCREIWDIKEVAEEKVLVSIRDVKATLVTERSAEILKKYFHASIIGLGCESGSVEHCRKLGRGYPPSVVKRAVDILNKYGLSPKINLIIGLPGQNKDTVEDTLRLIDSLEDNVLYFDAARFEALPGTAFENCKSDFGPITDVDTKRLFERVKEVHEKHINEHLGDRWKVLIGVYNGKEILPKPAGGGPKRRFRQMAGVVGYPVSNSRDLNSMATVVKIVKPTEKLKTGDLKEVEIVGFSHIGFRVIPEGKIVS